MSLQISMKHHKVLQIVQQEMKKIRTGRLSWQHIIKNKKYAGSFSQNNLIPNHEDHQKKMKQAFRKGFKEIPAIMIDKQGNSVPRYYYDTDKQQFVRRNQFQDIKNDESLFKFIQKHPKGVLVSDQLLQFTYKQVQKDIEKLLSEKRIKKINSGHKNKKDYYVFSNSLERQYGLSETYDFFGQKDFINLCKENYKYYEDLNQDEMATSTNTMFLPTSQRFNEWVPGYAELKKEWLLKNQEKQRQKSKN